MSIKYKRKATIFTSWLQIVEKVHFYKNGANSLSLTPNPFPVGRGYITGATAPRPCWGLRPSTPFLIMIEVFRQTEATIFTSWLQVHIQLYILCYLVAHLRAGQLCHTLAHNIAGAETVLQHLAYCIFNCVSFLYHIKAVTEHHCG